MGLVVGWLDEDLFHVGGSLQFNQVLVKVGVVEFALVFASLLWTVTALFASVILNQEIVNEFFGAYVDQPIKFNMG